jgi:hypothetical protein
MSDHPGTRIVIVSDETLVEAVRHMKESTDVSDINAQLCSIRAYVASHKDIAVTTLDEVAEVLTTMLVTTPFDGICEALHLNLRAVRDCTFPHKI